jgi:hypothetical protein
VLWKFSLAVAPRTRLDLLSAQPGSEGPKSDPAPLWFGAKIKTSENGSKWVGFDRSGQMTVVLLGRPRNIFRHHNGRLFTEEPFPNNLEAALCVERFCRNR